MMEGRLVLVLMLVDSQAMVEAALVVERAG